MPTRFSYLPVNASSYALTPAELLLADDKDLNEYIGLKKLAPYRKDKRRGWDEKRAARLKEFREKTKGRQWVRGSGVDGGWAGMRSTGEGEAGERSRPKKKRLGRKERKKLAGEEFAPDLGNEEPGDGDPGIVDDSNEQNPGALEGDRERPKKRKRKKVEVES